MRRREVGRRQRRVRAWAAIALHSWQGWQEERRHRLEFDDPWPSPRRCPAPANAFVASFRAHSSALVWAPRCGQSLSLTTATRLHHRSVRSWQGAPKRACCESPIRRLRDFGLLVDHHGSMQAVASDGLLIAGSRAGGSLECHASCCGAAATFHVQRWVQPGDRREPDRAVGEST
jgi:hypothetical protein